MRKDAICNVFMDSGCVWSCQLLLIHPPRTFEVNVAFCFASVEDCDSRKEINEAPQRSLPKHGISGVGVGHMSKARKNVLAGWRPDTEVGARRLEF